MTAKRGRSPSLNYPVQLGPPVRADTYAQAAGSSSTPWYPVAGPTPKKTKLVDENGEAQEAEKRAALFKKKCPKNIEERVERVMSQRFFCVERTRTGETTEAFKVLGSTGNVYFWRMQTVTICKVPQCTCPDRQKGNHCKHLLFVFLKILHVPISSNLWYQKAFLTEELSAIFANAPRDRADAMTDRLRTLFKLATGQLIPHSAGGERSEGTPPRRLPAEGDSCPVCYEDFEVGQEKGLVFCVSIQGCGNGIHSECFQQWAAKQAPVTCVFCRAKWPAVADAAAVGPSYSSEGYLNLAGVAGLSQHRDTSTYYRGPRRGKRWDEGYGYIFST